MNGIKKANEILLVVLLGVVLLSSCSTYPKHASLRNADLPELVPLRDFFINIDSNFGYRVSPDGKKIAWIAVKNRRLTIYFKSIGKDDIRIIDSHSPQNIYEFRWAQDSRMILYPQDHEGNEDFHIFLVDTENPSQRPVDLTPFEKTRARIHRIIRSDLEHVLIVHNRRDKHINDLYRINLNTYTQTLIALNPGDVFAWITDNEGNLRARIRKDAFKKHILEILLPRQNTWTKLIAWEMDEIVSVVGFTNDNKGIWLVSNRGRDHAALVKLNIQTGKEHIIYDDPQVDIERIEFSDLTNRPLLAVSYPDYQKLVFFDPELEDDLEPLKEQGRASRKIISMDNRERILTLCLYSDKGVDYYLLDRDTHKKVLLNRHSIAPYAESLSTMKPVSFQSRDGLTIHGYLTLPKGTSGKGLPMILFVHGGPWARDYWSYREHVQFLANRGYAVLQINYRGSIGYGKAFKEAAIGEFAGKMHDDLIDGVQWAISEGVADPRKIGIFGGSYGGYATLVGLTFTPDTFACGIDIVGMSNLVSMLKTSPLYWKLSMDMLYKYVGNPDDPEDRREMEAKSPLFRVDQIKKPLLIAHGGNDPRVKQAESDQIVAALRKEGKAVEFLLFPDEGHGIRHWKNRLILYRQMEDFLAEHLGGRSAGFDYYELGLLFF